MRVLYVSSLFPVSAYTGGTRVPLEQANAVRARGHQVELFGGSLSVGAGGRPRKMVIDGMSATLVNVRGHLGPGDPGFRGQVSAGRAFALVLDSGFDIVHFHSVQGLGPDMIRSARLTGAKTLVQMHDFFSVCQRQFLVTGAGLPCSRRDSPGCGCGLVPATQGSSPNDLGDLTLVPTVEMGKWLANMGISRQLHVGGQPAADLPEASAIASNWDTAAPYLVYLGGTSTEKGWMVLLESAWAADPGSLRVLCPGVNRHAIPDELSAKLIAGPRASRAEVASLLRSAHGAVVPSVAAETYSYVAREALSVGTRVIITDGPGGVAVVAKNPSSVTLIPRGSPDHLGTAMHLLLSKPDPNTSPSPPSRVDLGAELEDIYEQLLSNQGTRP